MPPRLPHNDLVVPMFPSVEPFLLAKVNGLPSVVGTAPSSSALFPEGTF